LTSERCLTGAEVAILTATSVAGRAVLRHSTAHVLAQAVLRLWPGAHYAIGPVIEDGFYYDFELPDGAHFSDDDLERIGPRCARSWPKTSHSNAMSTRSTKGSSCSRTSRSNARSSRRGPGADEVDADAEPTGGEAVVSTIGTRPRSATCARTARASTAALGHFTLMRVAGAYWRGDEKRPQLQRIYGTAWESEAALKEHLHRLEEAERLTDRKLGAELDLFSFPDEIGSGLAVFHPRGGTVRRLMEDYSRQRQRRVGLRVRLLAPHHQVRTLRDLGPPGVVRGFDVPAHGARWRD